MTTDVAQQVADLLNAENRLAVAYTADKVLAGNFIVELDGDRLLGVVEVAKVQWYQAEIRHLSVVPGRRRHGIGSRLVEQAEARAKAIRARIAQATIRADNLASRTLFGKLGFLPTIEFHNELTGRPIVIYQKPLAFHHL